MSGTLHVMDMFPDASLAAISTYLFGKLSSVMIHHGLKVNSTFGTDTVDLIVALLINSKTHSTL